MLYTRIYINYIYTRVYTQSSLQFFSVVKAHEVVQCSVLVAYSTARITGLRNSQGVT